MNYFISAIIYATGNKECIVIKPQMTLETRAGQEKPKLIILNVYDCRGKPKGNLNGAT